MYAILAANTLRKKQTHKNKQKNVTVTLWGIFSTNKWNSVCITS